MTKTTPKAPESILDFLTLCHHETHADGRNADEMLHQHRNMLSDEYKKRIQSLARCRVRVDGPTLGDILYHLGKP